MARDDREVIVVERDGGGGSLKWLVLGAAVGAGLALLFAPRTGRELRRDLSKRIRNIRELADDTIDELRDELADEEPVHRSSATDGAYDESEEAEPVEHEKATPAVGPREELERRLAAARARRRRVVPEDDEEPVA